MNEYDLIVIGGGPAGMMAAGQAGAMGAHVLLLEKNKTLGKKLLITGNRRCNITNINLNVKSVVEKIGQNGKFLFSSLAKFDCNETMIFFNDLGIETKIEKNGRVFPKSDKAEDILNVLMKFLKENKVEIKTGVEIKKINSKENNINYIETTDKEKLIAKKYAICTGGKSYAALGSSGDAYGWLKNMNIKIVDPRPALGAIKFKEKKIKKLEGVSFEKVKISFWRDKTKIEERQGEIVFTECGISGPVALDSCGRVSKHVKEDKIKAMIDFLPEDEQNKLDEKIQGLLQKQGTRSIKNIINQLITKTLVEILLEDLKIDPNKKASLINRRERMALINLLKGYQFEVSGVDDFKRAMVTAGGIDLKEINPKTMQIKKIDNLYAAGEILDLDGPSGGYNLQICWSTGYALGNSI